MPHSRGRGLSISYAAAHLISGATARDVAAAICSPKFPLVGIFFATSAESRRFRSTKHWWSARNYELLPARARPSDTKHEDAQRWVSRGCHGSHVTSGHGCWADVNGDYGQPVAAAGP